MIDLQEAFYRQKLIKSKHFYLGFNQVFPGGRGFKNYVQLAEVDIRVANFFLSSRHRNLLGKSHATPANFK